MNPFDITCTATLRPELLEKTLNTFHEKLFKHHIEKARLIINVDMTGADEDHKDLELVEIMQITDSLPFSSTVLRVGEEPHFPTAFIWCMEQVEAPLVFHLEEDWELKRDIDFETMVHLFDRYKNLAHLRLSYTPSEKLSLKQWNRWIDWNGRFYEVSKEERCTIGWAGHPSLNRTKFMKDCLKHIDPRYNPEKQIKGSRNKEHPMNKIINDCRFGVYQLPNKPESIKDIGRKWMVENGYRKKGNKSWFINWERSSK